jgi:5-amino-6-(5-phosphoribosylamino)uracil reductase
MPDALVASKPVGPGSPYALLFTEPAPPDAQGLPDAFRAIYPGDWPLPARPGRTPDRPYVYSNFAISRDGRISFNLPGHEAAAYVTKADAHDRWLMGLLRMRADAVLIGDNAIRMEPDYLATPGFVAPWDATAFTAQRAADGLAPTPLLVVLSLDGRLPPHAACLHDPDHHLAIATTRAGSEHARTLDAAGPLDVLDLGETSADLHRLLAILHADYGVRALLCEGGARVQAGMLAAGLIDEEFVTWCSIFVGQAPGHVRPSYTEGVAWTPATAPHSLPVSLHRAGEFLYLRTRVVYADG